MPDVLPRHSLAAVAEVVTCVKSDVLFSDILAEAERSMGRIDPQAIDDAADAAILLSGLVLENQEQPFLLDAGKFAYQP